MEKIVRKEFDPFTHPVFPDGLPLVHVKSAGVYLITNTTNGKIYVGSASKSIIKRLRWHRSELRSNKHGNSYLQRAWNKHGEKAFVSAVLELCLPQDCIRYEQFWIDELGAYDKTKAYNICPKAGSSRGAKLGPLSEERKKRNSEWNKKYYADPKARELSGKYSRLRWSKPGAREEVLDHWKAYWSDDENRRKRSISSKKMWESPVYREKVIGRIKAHWANPVAAERNRNAIAKTRSTKESRNKTSEANKKLWRDQGYRDKVLASRRSPENKKRQAELARRLWNDPAWREKKNVYYLSESFRKRVSEIAERKKNDPLVQEQRRAAKETRYVERTKSFVKEVVRRYNAGETTQRLVKSTGLIWNDVKQIIERAGIPYRGVKESRDGIREIVSKSMKSLWANPEFKAKQSLKIKAAMAKRKEALSC